MDVSGQSLEKQGVQDGSPLFRGWVGERFTLEQSKELSTKKLLELVIRRSSAASVGAFPPPLQVEAGSPRVQE